MQQKRNIFAIQGYRNLQNFNKAQLFDRSHLPHKFLGQLHNYIQYFNNRPEYKQSRYPKTESPNVPDK